MDVCCPNTVEVPNPPSSFKVYQADVEIISTGEIKDVDGKTDIIFQSGNNIQLNPGFEVGLGALFRAIINPCAWPY